MLTSKPTIVERYADNGEHSHYDLINSDTGETLWSEPEDPIPPSPGPLHNYPNILQNNSPVM
jgi:hypothetical protein